MARELSEERKQKMQEGRKRTAEERDQALDVLECNPQILNPKFWRMVDPDLQDAIVDCIRKARRAALEAEADALRQRLAELEAELQ